MKIILIIYFIIPSRLHAIALVDTNTCSRKELIFHKISKTKLDLPSKYILLNKTVKQAEDCFGTCQYQILCRSFNAIQINANQIQCQFLKLHRYHVSKHHIVKTLNSSYFEINEMSSCFMKQPKDCTDIYKEGMHENGEYSIFIKGKHHQVLCDMDTGAFGYTVIQKRRNGKISFARNFEDGFWIGNELIKTQIKHNGNNYFAVYENFNVASESEKYKLTVSGYQSLSNAIDSLSYHDGVYFSTYDRDSDTSLKGNCAYNKGGYWHKNCQHANLNGFYYQRNTGGIYWRGIGWGISETEIKIRQIEN